MIAAALELTNFINPHLTWKTISKGRNTSRRSRRPVSKTPKMGQDQLKKNLQLTSVSHSSEFVKSDVSIQRRGINNMEHIPIKKRRFLLRSPSPLPLSPNHCEKSQERDSSQCTLDRQIHSDKNSDHEATDIYSSASVHQKCDMDGIVEKTASSFDAAHVSSEDFSGIAILAAVACSSGLDCSVGNIEKSTMGDLLKRDDEESFASATNVKESNAITESTDCLGMAAGQLMEKGFITDVPCNSTEIVSLKNMTKYGRCQVSELSRAEPTESFASEINRDENIKCCGSAGLVNNFVVHSEGSSSNLANEHIKLSDETAQTSVVPRNCRLHWDLNTVMDEWDHPIDGKFDVPSTSAMSFQKPEHVEMSTPPEKPLATESGDGINTRYVACSIPENKALPDSGGLTSVITGFYNSGCSLGVSSDLVTTPLKRNCSRDGASSRAIETNLNGDRGSTREDVVVTKPGSDVGHPLSLGMDETKNFISYKGHDTSTTNLVKMAEESSESTSQSKVHDFGFSLAAVSEDGPCEVRDVDCGHTKSKERGATKTFRSVSFNFLDANNYKYAALGASHSGNVSCKTSVTDSGTSRPMEYMRCLDVNENNSLEAFTRLENSQSSGFEVTLPTTVNKHAISMVTANEIEENFSSRHPPTCDNQMEILPNVTEVSTPMKPTGNLVNHLDCSTPGNHGGRKLHIFSEVSSQVTENTANVANVGGGYDSHLEDGELRESVRHCWEDNQGEDAEREHVNYDSDNRDGILLEPANDSVQLSGEVLSEDCEKHQYHLDKCSSAIEERNLDMSVKEICSLQHQDCVLSIDAKMTDTFKRESPMLKACSGAQLKGDDRVEGDCKHCGISDVEVDRSGKEYSFDALRTCKGASVSGREFQFSDRRSADSIRSRSNNYESMHPAADCSGESLARHEPLEKVVQFASQSRNVELKSGVSDSVVPEESGERIVRASEDTPSICQPRIISISRSEYNPMRRGSPGERNNGYGIGMVKDREINLDSNSRNKLNRFSGGTNRSGFREGYHRPGVYEGGESSGPMLNRFGKRERSFSPVDNRINSDFPRSHVNSGSRPRTRSPDFRSENRMERSRLAYQQPGHSADHIRERRSPVRGFNQRQRFESFDTMGSQGGLRSDDCMRPMIRPVRFNGTTTSGRDPAYEESDRYRRKPLFMHNNRRSPSRSRSFSPDFLPDARMRTIRGPHIRERRSHVRAFRPARRYDDGESPGRIRSDNCMRPMTRPGRFNDTSQTNRGNDYINGGNDYRRKPQNIFERIHPVRQYDGDGDGDGDVNGRRFQCDEQDNHGHRSFRRSENYVEGGDRRPMEFRREERGNLRYNNSDRMFYSGSKQFEGM